MVYIPWIPSLRRYSWYIFLEYLLYVSILGIYVLITFPTSIFWVYIPWIPSLRGYSWYICLDYLLYLYILVIYSLNTFSTSIHGIYSLNTFSTSIFLIYIPWIPSLCRYFCTCRRWEGGSSCSRPRPRRRCQTCPGPRDEYNMHL